jgi:glycosyltransferase involved in cell wall biosynthesis
VVHKDLSLDSMSRRTPITRCDLHMHSGASVMNDEWYTKYFSCPESFADPVRQYELCKLRGMTLVTLTDHDTIAGGLRLVDRPDFFLSEEVTTRFPENGCIMHVLVWNITESHHCELQRVRENIYDIVEYLRANHLAHALAHPLLSSNWRLDAVTLEKALVLFPVLESINGLMDMRTDSSMAHLLTSLTPGIIEQLSRKHGVTLPEGGARMPALSAGSDDHVQRRCGTVFTEADGSLDVAGFLDAVMAGQARPVGSSTDLNRLAACANHTTYEYFRRECNHTQYGQGLFVDLMEFIAGRAPDPTQTNIPGVAGTLLKSLASIAKRIPFLGNVSADIANVPETASDEDDGRFISSIVHTSDALLAKAVESLSDAVMSFDLYGLLGALPDLVGAMAAATPLLFSVDHLARQGSQVRRIWKDWTAFPAPKSHEHLAIFSDSLDKIDGVSAWCGRFGRQASKAGRRVCFAACSKTTEATDQSAPLDLCDLPVIARFDLPFYPGFEITIPSLATVIHRMWREGITHVEVSTPGPMGLVGLAAARLLRLPVTASYHTDLPDLISTLSGQPGLANLARHYLRWFYRSVDRVFAFSPASRDKLVAMGVPATDISLIPVAVDPSDFSPQKSSINTFTNLGIDTRNRPIILSVGRLSEEKNLPLIVDAVERMQARANPPLLVVVGDGPARMELQLCCRDKEFVVFLGFKQGEVLRNLYASASLFVFASRVDTLGLVNLEALASGLPILVPSDSAIAQSLEHGDTALFFQPNPEDLVRTMAMVLDNPACASRLAEGGRRHTLARWQETDFDNVWNAMVRASSSRYLA